MSELSGGDETTPEKPKATPRKSDLSASMRTVRLPDSSPQPEPEPDASASASASAPTIQHPILPPQPPPPQYPAAPPETSPAAPQPQPSRQYPAAPPQQIPTQQIPTQQLPPQYPYVPPQPQSPQQPPQQFGSPPNPRPTRRPWLITSLVLVLALVGGLITWLALPDGAAPEIPAAVSARQLPFDQAVADLAHAPAVHYSTSGSAASTKVDVQVTGNGEAVGTATVDNVRFDMLVIAGKYYLKVPADLLDILPGTVPKEQLKDRWVTGDAELAGRLPKIAWQPWRLAMAVRDALNDPSTRFPSATDPAVAVGGTPALRADTPKGAVYITQAAPHHVLRLDPHQTRPPPATATPTLPIPGVFGLGTDRSAVHVADQAAAPVASATPTSGATDSPDDPTPASVDFPDGFDQFDLQGLPPQDTAGLYDQLKTRASELAKAVDAGIDVSLDGKVDSTCGPGGCTVNANVTNKVAPGSDKATVVGGEVSADMTATVSIEGTPAGSCTVEGRPLPLNGNGTLSCSIPGAGGVFAAADARNKAAAEATAQPGTQYTWETKWYAEAQVFAVAHVDVQILLDTLDTEKKNAARCPTPGYTTQSTRVPLRSGTTDTADPPQQPAQPPVVDNPRLQALIDDYIYKGVGNPNLVGDGTLMASANSEVNGGPQVEGANHPGKARETVAAIDNILKQDQTRLKGGKKVANPKTARDIAVANDLKKALNDALQGKYTGAGNYDQLKDDC